MISPPPLVSAPLRRHAIVSWPSLQEQLVRSLSDGGTLFNMYLRATVLLWMLGALTPAGLAVLLILVRRRWPRGTLVNLVVFSWIAVGVVQAFAAILNGIVTDDIATGLRNSMAFSVIGWVFGGLAIAAGAAHALNDTRVVRSMSLLGSFILVLAAIAAVGRFAGLSELRLWPTPLGLILPESNATTFYTSAVIFQTEATFGESQARLLLFFPWATALGLGSLAIAFTSSLERNRFWCLIGIVGGTVGVVFSWSRIAIASLLVITPLLMALRMPSRWRLLPIGLVLIGFLAVPLCGIDPVEQIKEIQTTVDSARAGSSLARELIYQRSWEGFLDSPVIGHGWIGESVHAKEDLPIGSHSTIFGLLYTGGVLTFFTFVLALLLTLSALLYRLVSCKAGSHARAPVIVAIGLSLCLVTYCCFESIYSLTLPCLFLFTWIGACLQWTSKASANRVAKWPETSCLAPRPPRSHSMSVFAKP